MRELPKPDHTESEQMSEDGQYWVRYVDLFTRDQVLAIQKQAYEDGLRDAAALDNFAVAGIDAYKLTTTRSDLSTREVAAFCFQFAKAMMAEREKAMLTASQKEQQ